MRLDPSQSPNWKFIFSEETTRKLVLLAFLVAVGIWLFYKRSLAPDVSAVNGTYYNACCGDVVLRDGTLFYKKASYKYDLELLKFGLTAYVHGRFTTQGVESSTDGTVFLFVDNDSGRRGFSTSVGEPGFPDAPGRDYSFAKVKS
jgi:hypothetical protein